MRGIARLAVVLWALLFQPALAAGPYTETYDSSLNGWVTSNELGSTAAWSWTNGYARLRFSAATPPDSTQSSLVSLTNASGGFFYGSYYAVGYPMIGFDFFCENIAPPLLYVSIASASNTIIRYILPDEGGIATQTWYRVMLPVDMTGSTKWFPSNHVEQVTEDVRHLAVAIKRPNFNVTYFRVDNVFLTALPYAYSLGLMSGEPVTIWESLRDGSTYEVQVSTNLLDMGGWTSVTSFTASGSSGVVTNGTDPTPKFQRIRVPVLAPR